MKSSLSSSSLDNIVRIGDRLRKEVIESPIPCVDTCQDLMNALVSERMSVAILEQSSIGKTMAKAAKAFKRHKRTEDDGSNVWLSLLEKSQDILKTWKQIAAIEAKVNQKNNNNKKDKQKKQPQKDSLVVGLPKTAAEYRNRLVKFNKELYKDPPVLPLPTIRIEDKNYGGPTRNETTGELSFKPGNNAETKRLLRDFHPNRTPEEVIRAGSFGGTYFRAIVSGVTNISYKPVQVLKETVQPEWIRGLDQSTVLTSSTYNARVNKYGVKCGGSLGMWESSGWITDCDPYGWFQWYCRFYQGRRCEDDPRQISRWLKSAGLKGRFRSQLCNKIIAANTKFNDTSISPVIRQTLLHWGLEITKDVLQKHKNRK